MPDMAEQNSDLTLFKRKYYWQYALLAMALAYLFLWGPIERWLSFESRTVEVTSVRTLCAAFEINRSLPLAVDECDSVRTAMAGRSDIEIKPRTFATFTYNSPADGSTRTVSVVRDLDSAGKPIAAGSRLDVELSRKEPGVYRVP